MPPLYDFEDVWFSRRVVREGERMAVFENATGRVSFVDGPGMPFLYRSRVFKCRKYTADASAYLSVSMRDGTRRTVPGPVALFFDPVEHERIVVEPAICLNPDELIVVISSGGSGVSDAGAGASAAPDAHAATVALAREARQRIVRGPCTFFPNPSDWIREFCWGRMDDAPGSGTTLTKLRCVPDSLRVDIDNVRSTDDIILVVHFEITMQLTSVEDMLAVPDPIKVMTNALVADVVSLSSKLSFDMLRSSLDMLNTASAYPTLTSRAQAAGFTVQAVAFRGYEFGTPALTAMRERAVQTRAQLAIEREETEQRENLLAMRQHKESERARLQMAAEAEQARHRRELEAEDAAHALRLEHERSEARKRETKAEAAAALEIDQARAKLKVDTLHRLHAELGVDVTKVLIAEAERQPTDSSFLRLRLEGAASDGVQPAVHLHTSAHASTAHG